MNLLPFRQLSAATTYALIGALLSIAGSAAAQQFTFRVVALTGQPAPGAPAGVTYLSLNVFPSINAAGETTFGAFLTGPGVTGANNEGFWSGPVGTAAQLTRRGSQAPGLAAGVTYASYPASPALGSASRNVFFSLVQGPGVTTNNDDCLWLGAPGAVALLGRSGDQPPGLAAGIVYNSFITTPAINASGQSAFVGVLGGAGVTTANDLGIWRGTPGNLTFVVREGDPAPGTPAGVNYASFEPFSVRINAAGQIGFQSDLSGPGIVAGNDSGIWVGTPGSLALLARESNQAPGTPAGTNYLGISFLAALNSGGQVTFTSSLVGPGVTPANDSGIWTGATGSVALLAREGDQAPGTAAGITYQQFENFELTINAFGQNVFFATVTGPGVTTANESGLWKGAPGSLVKVAREGEAAPGAGPGAVFGDFSLTDVAFNDRSQVAFEHALTGPNVTAGNDDSLWFSDTAGAPALVAREGSLFPVGPGDSRTVSEVNLREGSGDEDGFGSGLNDRGQVVFRASFTDGTSGIFISTPVLQLTAAVSRKIHGGLAAFDINLPLTGAPGVECRSSNGNHTLVLLFNNDLVSGSASVTSGTGVAGTPTFSGSTMTVPLTGVTDVQKITVTLANVTDNFAQVLPNTAVSMNLLIGDTTGNKEVNTTDISQTKALAGGINGGNFRTDVITNGEINTSDIGLVKSRSGASVP